MKKKYNYFYKIMNNINNHYYYGVHCTDNLDDGYMGSGTRLKYAYKKYGMENFTKEILKYFNTMQEAYEYEAEIVTESLVHDPECYNIQCGGQWWNTYETVSVKDKDGNYFRCSKYDPKYLNGEYISVSKNKLLVKDKNDNVYYIDKNDPRYISGELIPYSVGKICVKDKKTGKLHYIDSKQFNENIYEKSSTIKDKVTVKDKNNNYYHVFIDDPRLLSGEFTFMWKGRKHNEITKQKISKKHLLNKHQQKEKNSQYGTCWVYKFNENDESTSIKIKKEELNEYLSKGWIKGRKIVNKENIQAANKDKVWIYKDNKTKFIYKYDLNQYLENGWLQGRPNANKKRYKH